MIKILLLNHYFINLAFKDSWEKLVPAEKRKQVFSDIKEQLNKKAENDNGVKLSLPFVIVDSIYT